MIFIQDYIQKERLLKKLIDFRKSIDEANENPDKYAEIGKFLVNNPEIHGYIIGTLIMEIHALKEDNERHKFNANGFQKIMQIANHNDIVLKNRIEELHMEIMDMKNTQESNPVCECGHLSGDHTGNGNCVNCSCQLFKARRGGGGE